MYCRSGEVIMHEGEGDNHGKEDATATLLGPLLLFEKFLNVILEREWVGSGCIPLVRSAFVIDQELAKVPTNIRCAIVRGKLLLQEGKDLACLGPIDVVLFEPDNVIAQAKLVDKVEDVLVSSWFLAAKLIARKAEDLEVLALELVQQLLDFGIILFGQTSFRSHIDRQQDASLEAVHLDLLARHVLIDQIVECPLHCGFLLAKNSLGYQVLCLAQYLRYHGTNLALR